MNAPDQLTPPDHLKLIVAIKSVASLDDDFKLLEGTSRVDPDCVEFALNEWDEFALEAALTLREQTGEGEVLVVTVGDEQAEEALRRCLAKGADRVRRIWDDTLVDADPLAIARVLAAVVEREGASLVLCGVQSSDAANGATGVALAGFLGLPRVAVVRGLAYDASRASATVERELEGGLVEVLRVRTPAVLTIQTGIEEPRCANLRAIKQAAQKPLQVTSPHELGLDDGCVAVAAGSRSRGLRPLERNGGAEMLRGNASEVAARIAAIVHERIGR
jgi:electron transfer flavoprotein beta subunit